MNRLVYCCLVLATVASTSAIKSLNEFNWTQITSPLRRFEIAQQIDELIPDLESRIVGGSLATVNQFPHQAALIIEFNRGEFFCGGSIISEFVILTAAHCLYGGPIQAYVFLGLFSIDSATDVWANIVGPSQMTLHSRYNDTTLINDIAIIRFPASLPIPMRANIQIISLPSRDQANNLLLGESATASGWGFASDRATDISNNLRYVLMPIITNTACSIVYVPGLVRGSNLCVSGAGGRGTCSGDSGGPLTVLRGETAVLVGITSFGAATGCEIGAPSVFTRVGTYIDWLRDNADIIIPITPTTPNPTSTPITSTVDPNGSIAREPSVVVSLIVLLVIYIL